MKTENKTLFVTDDGKNLMFTFMLVTSLFFLWGFCNGMIDVMDKHFQTELGLSKSQSAWVQFAHYLGYFLMALPAGLFARKLGYKGGIIAGLLMVAAGGFWFMPATWINGIAQANAEAGTGVINLTSAFVAFLVGVCAIAAGLTFLETIANPYTTVLGPQRYAATRINLAQSCNGIGWIFGPIVGAKFFYALNESGQSMGSELLYIPYVCVAVVVLVLSVVFYLAYIPDIKAEDDYHIDDATPTETRSIWTRWHFTMAVVAQFFYVAAQAGIFSFFINYMTAETPSVNEAWRKALTCKNFLVDISFEPKTAFAVDDLKNLPSLVRKLKAKDNDVSKYLVDNLGDSAALLASYQGDDSRPLRVALAQDLNKLIGKTKIVDGIKNDAASEADKKAGGSGKRKKAKAPADKKEPGAAENVGLINRRLLQERFPEEMPFDETFFCISDSAAATLASIAFICFLVGRFSGAALLKRFAAHSVLALYAFLNVLVCALIFLKLGWISVLAVFASYFFMSIMFPTIFALGIFGLGSGAKNAAACIVMAIMGGAILPKLMGYIADQYDMSKAFIVPLACFGIVALYGLLWPKLANAKSLHAVSTGRGY